MVRVRTEGRALAVNGAPAPKRRFAHAQPAPAGRRIPAGRRGSSLKGERQSDGVVVSISGTTLAAAVVAERPAVVGRYGPRERADCGGDECHGDEGDAGPGSLQLRRDSQSGRRENGPK